MRNDSKSLENKITNSSGYEAQVLKKEFEELQVTLNRAEKYNEQCRSLLIRYDSAQRIVERNRKLGNLIDENANNNLANIEIEIRNFMKETIVERLKRD